MPNINPRQMQKMMRQMGIQQEDLHAVEVIIRLEDKDLVFENPQVAKVNMMGQQTYQIVGEPQERARDMAPDISDDDIDTVMEQAGVDAKTAREKLEETNGDLAEAILQLSQ